MEAQFARALAELRTKRAEVAEKLAQIDEAIASTERAAGIVRKSAPKTASRVAGRRGPRSAFIPAVLKLLYKGGEPQMLTTQQIVDELLAAKFAMDAKDPYR